jgi:Beta-lactamase
VVRVTDVSNPQPGNADTLFRPASIAKTFTGTAAERLIDQGRAYDPGDRSEMSRTSAIFLPKFCQRAIGSAS